METAGIYRERFGTTLGFELLMMFDLPDFEKNLEQNAEFFAEGTLLFHEPVWGVNHTAPKGSRLYEEGMYHLRLTKRFAEILRPQKMVYHLNNLPVPETEKQAMLRTSLENLEEMREMFSGTELLVENTGIRTDGTMLLDQEEFTGLIRDRKLGTLIDVGHANANGWDIPKLIRDLQGQIGGFHLHNNDGAHDQHNRLRDGTLDFEKLIPLIEELTPEVPLVIEYTRTAFHGQPLMDDILFLRGLTAKSPAGK